MVGEPADGFFPRKMFQGEAQGFGFADESPARAPGDEIHVGVHLAQPRRRLGAFARAVAADPEDADRGELRADDLGRVQPLGLVRGGHADIDDGDVGLVRANGGDERLPIARLRDDLEPRSLQQTRQPGAEQDVIFGQSSRSRVEIVMKGSTLNRFLEEVKDAAVQVVPL